MPKLPNKRRNKAVLNLINPIQNISHMRAAVPMGISVNDSVSINAPTTLAPPPTVVTPNTISEQALLLNSSGRHHVDPSQSADSITAVYSKEKSNLKKFRFAYRGELFRNMKFWQMTAEDIVNFLKSRTGVTELTDKEEARIKWYIDQENSRSIQSVGERLIDFAEYLLNNEERVQDFERRNTMEQGMPGYHVDNWRAYFGQEPTDDATPVLGRRNPTQNTEDSK